MELDELKDRTRKVKAPAFSPTVAGDVDPVAEDLVARMKAVDAKDAKSLRGMMILVGTAGAFALALFTLTWILPPDQDPNYHRVILAVMGLLFVSLWAIYRSKSRELSGMEYAMSVRSFLDKSITRYRFFPIKGNPMAAAYLMFVVAILVTGGVSWVHSMPRYFPALEDSTSILIYCAILVVAAVFGVIFRRKDWKKRKAPILEELRRMKAELTQEELDPGTSNTHVV